MKGGEVVGFVTEQKSDLLLVLRSRSRRRRSGPCSSVFPLSLYLSSGGLRGIRRERERVRGEKDGAECGGKGLDSCYLTPATWNFAGRGALLRALVVFTFQIPSGGGLTETVEAMVWRTESDVPFFASPGLV